MTLKRKSRLWMDESPLFGCSSYFAYSTQKAMRNFKQFFTHENIKNKEKGVQLSKQDTQGMLGLDMVSTSSDRLSKQVKRRHTIDSGFLFPQKYRLKPGGFENTHLLYKTRQKNLKNCNNQLSFEKKKKQYIPPSFRLYDQFLKIKKKNSVVQQSKMKISRMTKKQSILQGETNREPSKFKNVEVQSEITKKVIFLQKRVTIVDFDCQKNENTLPEVEKQWKKRTNYDQTERPGCLCKRLSNEAFGKVDKKPKQTKRAQTSIEKGCKVSIQIDRWETQSDFYVISESR